MWKDGRSVESRDRKLAVNGPDEAIVGPGGISTPTNPQACSICRTHAGEHTLRALWILGVLIIRGDHNMNVGIHTKPAFSFGTTHGSKTRDGIPFKWLKQNAANPIYRLGKKFEYFFQPKLDI